MPLFLITGLPGTGKSTVWAELKERGYEAYDGDIDGLAEWYDQDWRPVRMERNHRTPEFLLTHTRSILRSVVEDLAARAADKPVFLCADPENEDDLRELFAQVFALVLDEDVRQKRLTTRTNNGWGKLPYEREYDKIFLQRARYTYPRFGYVTLDASQPPARIVDQILVEAGV